MKWHKIVFGMFSLVLFSLFGFSSQASAVSDVSSEITRTWTTYCENNNNYNPECSDFDYAKFIISTLSASNGQTQVRYSTIVDNVCTPYTTYSVFVFHSVDTYISTINNVCKIEARKQNYDNETDTIILTDTPVEIETPDCPECQECQVCPTIPENPYDNKFDAVVQAIYVVAGTMLVIYFFFCIYRIIIKAGKK